MRERFEPIRLSQDRRAGSIGPIADKTEARALRQASYRRRAPKLSMLGFSETAVASMPARKNKFGKHACPTSWASILARIERVGVSVSGACANFESTPQAI